MNFTFQSLAEKFRVHNQGEKAAQFETLCAKFVKRIHSEDIPDLAYGILNLLCLLSNEPLKSSLRREKGKGSAMQIEGKLLASALNDVFTDLRGEIEKDWNFESTSEEEDEPVGKMDEIEEKKTDVKKDSSKKKSPPERLMSTSTGKRSLQEFQESSIVQNLQIQDERDKNFLSKFWDNQNVWQNPTMLSATYRDLMLAKNGPAYQNIMSHDTPTWPYVCYTERFAVGEIFLILQGLPSEVFPLKNNQYSNKNMIEFSHLTPSSTASALENLTRFANILQEIRDLTQTLTEFPSVVSQALVKTIFAEVKSFTETVLSLQKEFLIASAKAPNTEGLALHESMTLIALDKRLTQQRRFFSGLQHILEEIKNEVRQSYIENKTSCMVAKIIIDKFASILAESEAFPNHFVTDDNLSRIFLECLWPYLSILSKWIKYGHIFDEKDEFFIRKIEVQTPNKKTMIINDFFSKKQGPQLYEVGEFLFMMDRTKLPTILQGHSFRFLDLGINSLILFRVKELSKREANQKQDNPFQPNQMKPLRKFHFKKTLAKELSELINMANHESFQIDGLALQPKASKSRYDLTFNSSLLTQASKNTRPESSRRVFSTPKEVSRFDNQIFENSPDLGGNQSFFMYSQMKTKIIESDDDNFDLPNEGINDLESQSHKGINGITKVLSASSRTYYNPFRLLLDAAIKKTIDHLWEGIGNEVFSLSNTVFKLKEHLEFFKAVCLLAEPYNLENLLREIYFKDTKVNNMNIGMKLNSIFQDHIVRIQERLGIADLGKYSLELENKMKNGLKIFLLNDLRFVFSSKFPNNFLFDDETADKYTKIFKFALRIKKTTYFLEKNHIVLKKFARFEIAQSKTKKSLTSPRLSYRPNQGPEHLSMYRHLKQRLCVFHRSLFHFSSCLERTYFEVLL
eukprot:TRINITY_DN5893_c0_g1_i10.p1 TRINITY_DN5893_c0_g1~~TRINITY_DN5893_c0_g1_i10.p1  ORF type:complete len:911 (+),score=178.07 TRINITY_DN5893_c0_g1_i10:258-2990(+)